MVIELDDALLCLTATSFKRLRAKLMVEVPNSDGIQGNAENTKEEGGVKTDSQIVKTGKDDSTMSSIPTKTESEEFGVTEAMFQKHPIFSSIAKETIMQADKVYGVSDIRPRRYNLW